MISNGIAFQAIGSKTPQLSRDQQEFRANVRSLIDAIRNADLDAAKKAYEAITESESDKAGKNEDAKSPFATLLSQIGKALDDGDIEAAQQALEAFEADRSKEPAPAVGRIDETLLPDGTKSAFVDLIKALRSDDLDGAKDAYSELLKITKDEEDAESASPFDTFLQQIGVALADDDLDAARDALDAFSQDNPTGLAFDLTA
jgi:outer membrane protein assembly factor BamD (BamD/ComL family)